MKKIVCFLLVIIQLSAMVIICNARVGDVIGYALHTDIIATINGAQIPSYNIDGYTYIVAEDLANYGFSVNWNPSQRLLTVNRNYAVRSIYSNYQKPYIPQYMLGKAAYRILESDITTSIGGFHISNYPTDFKSNNFRTCNINGRTLIPFDILEIFGTVYWNGSAREISLIIPGLNYSNGNYKPSYMVKNEFLSRINDINSSESVWANTAYVQSELNAGSHFYYRTRDALLNEIYQYLKQTLPYYEFEALKNDEINWVAVKEQAMSDAVAEFWGGSMAPLAKYSTGSAYTEDRCHYLISFIR